MGKLELCYLSYVEIHNKMISPQNQFSIQALNFKVNQSSLEFQGKSNKTTILPRVRKNRVSQSREKGIKYSRG